LLFTKTFDYLFYRFALVSLQLLNWLLLLLLRCYLLGLLNFMLLLRCDLLNPIKIKGIWVPLLRISFLLLLLLVLKLSVRISIVVDTDTITLS